MNGNSLGIILLAMAVGLVVGFEIGQHLMRKHFLNLINKAMEDARKQAEEQQKEREKHLEEIRKSAKRLQEHWENILKSPMIKPEVNLYPEEKEQGKKEQKENGI